MEQLSTTARDQSMRSSRPSQSRSAKWIRSQTPARCQSRRRRQHVIPDPHPSSCGSICQGMPLRRTKTMPVRHARSETRGRPPRGRRGRIGKKGSTRSHNGSESNAAAIGRSRYFADEDQVREVLLRAFSNPNEPKEPSPGRGGSSHTTRNLKTRSVSSCPASSLRSRRPCSRLRKSTSCPSSDRPSKPPPPTRRAATARSRWHADLSECQGATSASIATVIEIIRTADRTRGRPIPPGAAETTLLIGGSSGFLLGWCRHSS
jgi:hypothetical protein